MPGGQGDGSLFPGLRNYSSGGAGSHERVFWLIYNNYYSYSIESVVFKKVEEPLGVRGTLDLQRDHGESEGLVWP